MDCASRSLAPRYLGVLLLLATAAAQAQDAAAPAPTEPVPETQPAPAASATGNGFVIDPWERYNRRVHKFNKVVDTKIAKPIAQGYVKVVPERMRKGVRNFFNNLYQPVASVNLLLQGHPKEAGQALARFALNATLGLGGILDPATDAKLPVHEEDFGQTLATWGWRKSRYFVVPFLGPRTLRDAGGGVVDSYYLGPLNQIEHDRTRYSFYAAYAVDLRTQLFALDEITQGVEDDYTLLRDAWLQRRNYQINDREGSFQRKVLRRIPGLRDHGDEGTPAQNGVPDYLDGPLPDDDDGTGNGAPVPEYLNGPLPDDQPPAEDNDRL